MFLDMKLEGKIFKPERQQAFPEFHLLLIPLMHAILIFSLPLAPLFEICHIFILSTALR
jgi:hypothetical protein